MKSILKLVIATIQCKLGLNKHWRKLRPLPRFNGGGTLVDIADRDALYDAMDDLKLYSRGN